MDVQFFLGCNDCSATVQVASGDKIAAHLNTELARLASGGPKPPSATIYSKRLSVAQNEACHKLEAVSGIAPTGLADLDAGRLTPLEFWRLNLMVAHDIYAQVQNLSFPDEITQAG